MKFQTQVGRAKGADIKMEADGLYRPNHWKNPQAQMNSQAEKEDYFSISLCLLEQHLRTQDAN